MAACTQSPFTNSAATLNAYRVGNSLTMDSSPGVGDVDIAIDANTGLQSGYHIWTGHSLTQIVATPGTFDQVSPSAWNVALPAFTYDLLAFEPYSTSATIGSETTSFQTLQSAAQTKSPKARLFEYEAWPDQSLTAGAYQTYWNGSGTFQPSDGFTMQLGAFNAVYSALQSSYGSNIWVIPVGDVFNAIDVAARAGSIPGAATVDAFYRDTTHMGRAGQFVAACTVFATYYRKQCPVSFAVLFFMNNGNNGTATVVLTPTLASQLSALVWSVVSTDPRAIH